ncbi:MAG: bifunctional phosphoglucose/phosphomannose isomerase [Candidatus Omnitrophica bacterium]|nr:bifunctional phosphoglucose/phosphomannose isomerase [Candidatus Omnitrophota bacterium]
MNILDDVQKIKDIDKSNMKSMLDGFDRQSLSAWNIKLPDMDKKEFDSICLCGMGGSAVGGDIIKQVAEGTSTIIYVNRDYTLPRFVNEKSLVIPVSYSGDTEETISCYNDAKSKKASIWSISSGGMLEELSRKDGVPHVKVEKGFPPRCALGYLFFPVLKLFIELGIIKKFEIDKTFLSIKKYIEEYRVENEKGNKAKEFADRLWNKNPVVYSGPFLFPVAIRWKTQFAENSKNVAFINVFSELNHNEIMSWNFPEFLVHNTIFFFLHDESDHPRIKQRMALTEKILKDKNLEVINVSSCGEHPVERIFSLLVLEDWLSFYLAILNNMDPTEIKEITYLKKELAKT